MSYQSISDSIDQILQYGQGTLIAKADIEAAYRIVPIHPTSFHLLGFSWRNHYFVDIMLPFGLAVSCNFFDCFSRALVWVLQNTFRVPSLTFILDDFVFFGPSCSPTCQKSLSAFYTLAAIINLPIKQAKTVTPTTRAIILGILFDTVKLAAMLPEDKLTKAKAGLDLLAAAGTVTLRELQSVIGFLNFTCQIMPGGRAFLRRLYDLAAGVRRRHHRLRVTQTAKLDVRAWRSFLDKYEGMSLLRNHRWTNETYDVLRTDASGTRGYAAILGAQWIGGTWTGKWKRFHISVQELYPIVVGLAVWGPILANSCVQIESDNSAMVASINKQTSKHKTVMQLIRRLVVISLSHNILFKAKFVPGHKNKLADALSRLQFNQAFEIAPRLQRSPIDVPPHLSQESILQTNY